MPVAGGFAKVSALALHVEKSRADDAGTPPQNGHCSGFCLALVAVKKARTSNLAQAGFQSAAVEGQGSAPGLNMPVQQAKGGPVMAYALAEKHLGMRKVQQKSNLDVNELELVVEMFVLDLTEFASSDRFERR